MKKILITGAAGFIGYHLSKFLLNNGAFVVGFDNLNSYYDVRLKNKRLRNLAEFERFKFIKDSLEVEGALHKQLEDFRPDIVIHLAAQAGVRHSIEHPEEYLNSNLIGTFRLLEACVHNKPKHLLMASTSSAYGASEQYPNTETQKSDFPLSFYAASKKSTELMAHSYAYTHALPITMFRFFTVYGPMGRPDMALFKFVKSILEDKPIQVYNYGDMSRDFTYVEDLVRGINGLIEAIPDNAQNCPIAEDSISPVAPFRVVNIGNGSPVRLLDFIKIIEKELGKEAKKEFLPMQMGDIKATWASNDLLKSLTDYKQKVEINEGIAQFIKWYLHEYEFSNEGTFE